MKPNTGIPGWAGEHFNYFKSPCVDPERGLLSTIKFTSACHNADPQKRLMFIHDLMATAPGPSAADQFCSQRPECSLAAACLALEVSHLQRKVHVKVCSIILITDYHRDFGITCIESS